MQAQPSRWCAGVDRRHRGQVMVIALIAVTLLGGMVFYVFNVGDQVNRRVGMQDAADSAAISGSTWMARSMNVVAMNNVAQSRLIAMAAVLDGLPLATEIAYEELSAWILGLDAQLAKGVPDADLKTGLQSMADRFHQEQQLLYPLYHSLIESGYDVTQATFWRLGGGGSGPDGTLWQGAMALGDFSRATVELAGYISQTDATQMGQACGATTSFLVPVNPELPARQGQLDDFKGPIMTGRPPEWAGDTDFAHRGPYDQLFHWRMPLYDKGTVIGYQSVQGTAGPTQGAGGHGVGGKTVGTSVVGGPQDQQVPIIAPGPQIGWRTYGVYRWAVRGNGGYPSWGLAEFAYNNLPDTNYRRNIDTLTKAKLDYIWGNTSIKQIHKPEWICDYPAAVQRAQANPKDVKYTLFYMVQTKSSVPPTSAQYKKGSAFISNSDDPIAITKRGWVDPADWTANPQMSATKIADYIWQVDWQYQTTFDESIGLPRSGGTDAKGNPIWHDVYIREQYVFGGIDIGKDTDIRNPANWNAGEDLPRPWLLDLTRADYRSVPGERDYFSFLGVARVNSEPSIWGERFGSGDPSANVLAVAEAQVFNNLSWDLWTQNWEARLRRIDDWSYWVDARMPASQSQVNEVAPLVDGTDFAAILLALQGYSDAMVAQLLTH